MRAPAFRARRLAARLRQRRESRQRRMQEPREPDALALAFFADAVHAVVPVAGPDQGQAVPAERQAPIERQRAMLEQRRGLFGYLGLEEAVGLASLQRRALEERNDFVEHARIARRLDILRDGEGEPGPVVRNARAHALPRMRQPPVLNVALDELPPRRAQKMLAREIGSRRGERHAVLQLIAKAIGAARLIEGRARENATGEGLVEQPAVEHEIHRAVRRLDLDRAERLIPIARDVRLQRVEIGGAKLPDQGPRLLAGGRVAQKEHDFGDAAGRPIRASCASPRRRPTRRRRRWTAAPRPPAPPGSPARRCGR